MSACLRKDELRHEAPYPVFAATWQHKGIAKGISISVAALTSCSGMLPEI